MTVMFFDGDAIGADVDGEAICCFCVIGMQMRRWTIIKVAGDLGYQNMN